MFISAGLLYVHLRPDVVPGLGWNPPFRAYTAAVWFFFASNVFLVVTPWVPPAPGYQVFEHIPYYVSVVRGSTIEVWVFENLTADNLASYSYTVLWDWQSDLWASCIGM